MATAGRYALVRLFASGPTKQFSTSAIRNKQTWQQKGVSGSTLPFSIHNRYKVTLIMFLFMATSFNAPFFLVRHQLMKK